MWTTYDQVRRKIGLTSVDVEDADLQQYIEDAQREMLQDIAVFVRDEVLTGEINGSNTTFTTAHKFYADSNWDYLVNNSDIVDIYKWGEEGSISLRETITLSTIYPLYGQIILATAPADTFEVVTMSYWYFAKDISTISFGEACAFLSAYKYADAEFMLLPDQWMHGSYRFVLGSRGNKRPYEKLLDEYYNIISEFTSSVIMRDKNNPPFMLRETV